MQHGYAPEHANETHPVATPQDHRFQAHDSRRYSGPQEYAPSPEHAAQPSQQRRRSDVDPRRAYASGQQHPPEVQQPYQRFPGPGDPQKSYAPPPHLRPASQVSSSSHNTERAPSELSHGTRRTRDRPGQGHLRQGLADEYYDPRVDMERPSRPPYPNYAPSEETSSSYGELRLKSGFFGTVKGMWDLHKKKDYIFEDTPDRLELLRRADDVFSGKFVGKHGHLNKGKVGRFREEIERVERVLQGVDSRDIRWHSGPSDADRRRELYEDHQSYQSGGRPMRENDAPRTARRRSHERERHRHSKRSDK